MQNRWKRFAWDLWRFGLMPSKLWARLSNRNEPRILLISVPKAGTHLLERALCLHPRLYRKWLPTLHSDNLEEHGSLENLFEGLKPGQILVSHLHYSAERWTLIKKHSLRCVFIVRDPRDVVVSRAHYIARNRKHPYHFLFQDKSLEERLKLAILGNSEFGCAGIGEMLEQFVGWSNTSSFLIHFEQLISVESRLHILRNLYSFLDIDLDKDRLSFFEENIVSSASPTFRRGAIGEWKKVFNEEINMLFERTVDRDMIEWCKYA